MAKTAVAKAKPALPANFQDQVQNDLAAFKSRLATVESNAIRVTQDKKFRVPHDGEAVKVDTITGIIVDFAAHRRLYEGVFDRENPTPPTCFAVGFVPHAQLEPSMNSPENQNPEGGCTSCSKSEWKKDAKDKWIVPPCKESFVLALIAPDSDELMTLSVSSTAVKHFTKYVRDLAASGKTPYQVVTHFSFDPKEEYPSVRFTNDKDVPKDVMGVVMSVRDDAIALVSQEPKTDGFEEKVVAKRLPAPKARGRK